MQRSKLKAIIHNAAVASTCEPEDVQRLVDSADGIDYVLVGYFEGEVKGQRCGCPATAAGYFSWDNANGWNVPDNHPVRNFPDHFDNAIPNDITLRNEKGQEYIKVTDA